MTFETKNFVIKLNIGAKKLAAPGCAGLLTT
jgi:hypothetical protein